MSEPGCKQCTEGKNVTEDLSVTRRSFFERVGNGIFGTALTTILCEDLFGGLSLVGSAAADQPDHGRRRAYDLKPRPAHFAPKAKAVIQLLMNGAPSQMDLFDPKPALDRHHGESYLDQLASEAIFNRQQAGDLLRSPFKFAQHGESGMWMSEVMPHLAKQVDDIAMIRSMHTTNPAHPAGLRKFMTGRIIPGHPTLGAWVSYALGSENQNLPAFVVLDDPLGLPTNGIMNWQGGYLPPIYQGTRVRSTGDPILNLHPHFKDPMELDQLTRDLLNQLDQIHQRERPGQSQLDARIASYELAARMQMEATDALDLSQESPETLEMYGIGREPTIKSRVYENPGPDNYAKRCVLARRLVERGVRYVQICLNSQIWDNHSHLENELRAACDRTDQPVAALLKDLKQRGLLETTLVIWGGEFGRLPIAQMKPTEGVEGRDHNMHAFTVWMAGGGIKPGTVYGTTDDFGYKIVDSPVSVADFHATILHLLGLDHEKLFFARNGLEEKLTSIFEARVVKEILA